MGGRRGVPYLCVALARGFSRVMRDSRAKELSNEYNTHTRSFFTMTLLQVGQNQGNKDAEEIGDVYTRYKPVLHCIDCNESCGDAPWAPFSIPKASITTLIQFSINAANI